MKKNILFIGSGSISQKHISLINKKKFNIFLISRRKKKMKDIKIIDFNYAKKLKFIHCFLCCDSNSRLKVFNLIKNNSKTFFFEKPISDNYLKAKNFFRKKNNNKLKKKIYIGYVFKHHNLLRLLKKYIKKTKVNDILNIEIISKSFLPNWRKNIKYESSVSANKKKGGGVLLELSHEINFLIDLFGYKNIKLLNKKIYNSKCLKIDVEEHASILCLIKQKILCSMVLDFNSFFLERKIQIKTKNKYYNLDLIKGTLEVYSRNNKKVYRSKKEMKKMFKRQMYYFLNKSNFNSSVTNAIETLNFIDEVKKN